MSNDKARENVKTEWTIAVGDGHFTIVPAKPSSKSPHSDEFLNGRFPTKLAAVESAIASLESERRALGKQIARAKRMRSRLKRRAQ